MAQQTRANQLIFGSTGGTTEFGKIGSDAAGTPTTTKDLALIQSLSQYERGLFGITASAAEPPRIEDINALYFLMTSQLRYILQNGIPEWIATAEYYATVSYCQRGGYVYRSVTGTDESPNINNDPATDTGTNWEIIDVNRSVVETADNYTISKTIKTLLVTANGKSIDIDENYPLNAPVKIMKNAAYDGNAITITPPSGATFEGKSSISLYGQYSYVEIERISATVFAIRDLKDEFAYVPSVGITNMPGSWNTTLGRCVRKNGIVKILQRYDISGAVTGVPLYLQSNILPPGLAVLDNYERPITYQKAGVSNGLGVFHGTWAFSSADSAVWNATVPHTWKNGDTLTFELDYIEK